MASHTFYPNLPIFLHRYICHICDILQLWLVHHPIPIWSFTIHDKCCIWWWFPHSGSLFNLQVENFRLCLLVLSFPFEIDVESGVGPSSNSNMIIYHDKCYIWWWFPHSWPVLYSTYKLKTNFGRLTSSPSSLRWMWKVRLVHHPIPLQLSSNFGRSVSGSVTENFGLLQLQDGIQKKLKTHTQVCISKETL